MTLPGSISSLPPAENGSEDRLAEPDSATIRHLAVEAGFVEAGWVGLPHAQTERDAQQFAEFIEVGRAGTMDYLARRNEAGQLIRKDARVPFPWARSVIVCLASYHADEPLSTEPADKSSAWIARYAWSGRREPDGSVHPSDYHKVLMKRLRLLESEMHAAFGEFDCRAYVDTGPVVERSLARAAGVGWTGKNTCLIHPKLGSWNFLAVLVTSLEVPRELASLAVPDRCGSCRRCLDACPTGALIAPYQMDATRCISYLTIEHRGSIDEELMAGMGRQVFGCDICQDVCPWNRKAPLQPSEEADLLARRELVNPSLEWLAALDEVQFERLFNGSPVRRTGFLGLRRNIAIAMGNSGLKRFVPRLQEWLNAGDQQRTTIQRDEKSAARQVSIGAAVKQASRWALARIAERGQTDAPNTGQAESASGWPDSLS
jgi:epoxyqueuosine reductase